MYKNLSYHFYRFEYFESLLTLSNGLTITDSTIATFIIHILFILHGNEEIKKKKCVENCVKVLLSVYIYNNNYNN